MKNGRGPHEGRQGVSEAALIKTGHRDAVEDPQQGNLSGRHSIQGFPRGRKGARRWQLADGRVIGILPGELPDQRLERDFTSVTLRVPHTA